jgi:hypothetical protein
MFGVDIMLDKEGGTVQYGDVSIPQPVVLEVQYAPDCYRTHQTYPDFWDLTLSALFLGETIGMIAL